MTKRKTHFEQIPVAVVKKITKQFQPTHGEENVVFESPETKTEPYAIAVAPSNSNTPAGANLESKGNGNG